MPRPSTPTRNFPSQISPTPNRTGNMGRGSACDSRSHGNSRSGRGRFGWRNNSRRYSNASQNSGLRNSNSQVMSKSDPTMNQKANLAYFDINENVFHDDDASIIDGHISILTPVISTEDVADRDVDEPDLSQNDLSTISDIGVADESNDSFFSQEVAVRNDLPAGDSVDLLSLNPNFENGIEDSSLPLPHF